MSWNVTTKRGGKHISQMPLVQRLTGRVKGKIWSKLRWVEAALCQHEVVFPYIMSSLVPSTWLLAKIPGGLEKVLAFSSSHLPSPGESQPPTLVTTALVSAGPSWWAACRKLLPFLKDLQGWMQSLKHHPTVLSIAIPFSHSSTVGWEHHWQLFSNLSILLSFPSFSTVWYKDMWCSSLSKLTFLSSFFSLFLEVLIPKS